VNPYYQMRERGVARGTEMVWAKPWTPEELAEAVRLRQDGLGSSVIARKLKRTRNSVIGALWRAGEPRLLVNQHGGPDGQWSFVDQPARDIPLRFSEQRRVP